MIGDPHKTRKTHVSYALRSGGSPGAHQPIPPLIQLAGREPGTIVYLSHRSPGEETRSFRGSYFEGGRWVTEVSTPSAADTIAPRASVTLPGRHVINFQGEPTWLCLDYKFDAEGMLTREGVLRLEIDWKNRTAHVDDGSVSSDQFS